MSGFLVFFRAKYLRTTGQKLLTKGKFEKAYRRFHRAFLLQNSWENMFNLTLSQMALGRYPDAEPYLEKICRQFPENDINLLAFAECKLMLRKWPEAIELFTRLVELQPRLDSYKKYLQLSRDEVEREKFVSSKNLLIKASEQLNKKNDAEALKLLLEADEIYPGNANILNNIGSIYMLMQDYQKAYKYFTQALACDKNSRKIKNNILAARKKLKK